MNRRKLVTRILLVALPLLAICGWIIFHAGKRPEITFYGMVIDEKGQPVQDATVHLIAQEFRFGTSTSGQLIKGSANGQLLHTDANGRFSVAHMPGNQLTVMDVSKPGFQWVFDWAYLDPNAKLTNGYYLFEPKVVNYVADESRPAIFPLFRDGSQVAGKPSRGGSDHYPDGRIVQNEPVTPLIPSAGLGAPADNDERDERLLKLMGRKRPPWMPTKPATKPMPQ